MYRLSHVTYIYLFFFFVNDTATTQIYTLSLHDALPICYDDVMNSDDWVVKNVPVVVQPIDEEDEEGENLATDSTDNTDSEGNVEEVKDEVVKGGK